MTRPVGAPRSDGIKRLNEFLKGVVAEEIGAEGTWVFMENGVHERFKNSGDYYPDASVEISEILRRESGMRILMYAVSSTLYRVLSTLLDRTSYPKSQRPQIID